MTELIKDKSDVIEGGDVLLQRIQGLDKMQLDRVFEAVHAPEKLREQFYSCLVTDEKPKQDDTVIECGTVIDFDINADDELTIVLRDQRKDGGAAIPFKESDFTAKQLDLLRRAQVNSGKLFVIIKRDKNKKGELKLRVILTSFKG